MNPGTCRFFLVSAVVGAVGGGDYASKRIFGVPKTNLAASIPASAGQAQLEKTPRNIQPRRVNSVAEAGPDMPLDGYFGGSQTSARLMNGLNGDNLIPVAVDEQNGRTGNNLSRQALRPGEKPGKTNNGADPLAAARTDVKGHHAALTEAHEGERAVVKSKHRKFGVKKRIKGRSRVRNALPSLARIAKGKRKPLASAKRSRQRLGRVGRNESSVWQ